MLQAHRVICPVRDQQLHIDLPADFPQGVDVEVILLPLPAGATPACDPATAEWLRSLWATAPDFPDRPADLQPEPVEIP